jgi:hypothetical protein
MQSVHLYNAEREIIDDHCLRGSGLTTCVAGADTPFGWGKGTNPRDDTSQTAFGWGWGIPLRYIRSIPMRYRYNLHAVCARSTLSAMPSRLPCVVARGGSAENSTAHTIWRWQLLCDRE